MKKRFLHIFLITITLASCAPNNKPEVKARGNTTMINVQKKEKEIGKEVVSKIDTAIKQAEKNSQNEANSDNTQQATEPKKQTTSKSEAAKKSKATLFAESRFEEVITNTLGKGSFQRSIVNCAQNNSFCTDNISKNWLVKGLNRYASIDKDTILRIKYCQLEGKYNGRTRAYKIGRVEEWIVSDVQSADNIIRKLNKLSSTNWQKIYPQKVTYWRDQQSIFIIQPQDSYSVGFADALKKDMQKTLK